MVNISRPVEYYSGVIPQKNRVSKLKDRGNCFFWMACCSSPRPGYDLQNCSRIDFAPQEGLAIPEISWVASPSPCPRKNYLVTSTEDEKNAFLSSDSESWHSAIDCSIFEKGLPAESCNVTPSIQIPDNFLVDGVINTQIFWEVFVSGAWRKHDPRISEAIENV